MAPPPPPASAPIAAPFFPPASPPMIAPVAAPPPMAMMVFAPLLMPVSRSRTGSLELLLVSVSLFPADSDVASAAGRLKTGRLLEADRLTGAGALIDVGFDVGIVTASGAADGSG